MQDQALDYNPQLAPWTAAGESKTVGKGAIEQAGSVPNTVWQTRSAPPSAYENALGDALENAFEAGADSISAIVALLNAGGVRSADGRLWTDASFELEMRRLGQ